MVQASCAPMFLTLSAAWWRGAAHLLAGCLFSSPKTPSEPAPPSNLAPALPNRRACYRDSDICWSAPPSLSWRAHGLVRLLLGLLAGGLPRERAKMTLSLVLKAATSPASSNSAPPSRPHTANERPAAQAPAASAENLPLRIPRPLSRRLSASRIRRPGHHLQSTKSLSAVPTLIYDAASPGPTAPVAASLAPAPAAPRFPRPPRPPRHWTTQMATHEQHGSAATDLLRQAMMQR